MGGGELRCHRRIAEDLLHAALGIVKVAAHGHDADIVPRLRHHLESLDGADAAVGVEHHDADSLGIGETFECRLARIARGGDKDENRVLLPLFHARRAHQLREKLKCHVLKGTRRAMPEFEHLEITDRRHRGTAHIVKRLPIGAAHAARELLLCIVRQKKAQDAYGTLLV